MRSSCSSLSLYVIACPTTAIYLACDGLPQLAALLASSRIDYPVNSSLLTIDGIVRWQKTVRTMQSTERCRMCIRDSRAPVKGEPPNRNRNSSTEAAFKRPSLRCSCPTRTMGRGSNPHSGRPTHRNHFRMARKRTTPWGAFDTFVSLPFRGTYHGS